MKSKFKEVQHFLLFKKKCSYPQVLNLFHRKNIYTMAKINENLNYGTIEKRLDFESKCED